MNKEIENGPQFRFLFVSVRRVDEKFVADPVEGGSSALTTIVKSNGYTIISPHTNLKKGTKVRVTLFGRLELTQLSATRRVIEDLTRCNT
jgi:molybdopterin biosynthesis enzyme